MFLRNRIWDLFRFDAPTDKGSGDPLPPTKPNPAAPPADPAPNSGDDKEPGKEPGWLKPRLDEAHRAGVNSLLKELGIDKVDDLKSVLAKAKADQEAQMTELQKAQAKADAAEAARKKLEGDLDAAKQQRIADQVNSAILLAAKDARADHPQDVVDLLRKGDLASLVDDKGQVKTDAIKPLIEKVQKDRPAWFASGAPGSPSNRGGKTPVGDPDALKKLNGGKRLVNL